MSLQSDGSFSADVLDIFIGPEDMAEVDRHPIHSTACLFYPPGPGPFDLLIVGSNAGWTTTDRRTVLTSAQVIPHGMLARSKRDTAVLWLPMPVARGTTTLPPSATSDPTFNIDVGTATKTYGPAYRGNGVLIAPENWPAVGVSPPDYEAAHPGLPHPWLDDLWPMAEKTAIWAVQHFRFNKAKYNLTGRIGGYGVSGGGMSMQFPALFLDMADAAQPESQRSASSVLDFFLGEQTAFYFLCYRYDGVGVDGRMNHFPHAAGTPEWDIPAVKLENLVPFYPQLLHYSGPLFYAQRTTAQKDRNKAMPTWLHGAQRSGVPATFDGEYGFSTVDVPFDAETVVHTSWHQYLWKFVFGALGNVRLVVDSVAVDPLATTNAADLVIADGDTTGADLDALAWYDGIQSAASAEPVEEQVIAALEAIVAGVSVANGYMTDVRAVYRFPDLPDELPLLPAVQVRRAGCTKDHGKWANHVQATLRVDLDLVQATWQYSEVRLSRFIADVERALAADHTLGGLTHRVSVVSDDRVLAQHEASGSSIAVAFMSVEVGFRYLKTDPYTPYVTPS